MTESINLATLWVPILPELSHFNEKMREAGEQASRHLATGLGGGNVGANVGSQLGAGLLAGFQKTGVVSQLTGALGGINLKTVGLASAATAAVVGFYKLGEAVKSVGQDFEDINANIALFTGKSGPALDDLKAHADALVGTMDTGIKNLGVDVATLSTRLDLEAGPVLDRLTRHVGELRDRFGSLDIDKLTGAFVQLGISGDDADNVLASLSQSASAASEPLNTLIGDLAKAGPVAKDLSINAEQLGAMLTDIHKHGEDAGAGVDLLQRAQKAAKGENFAQFLQREVDIIDNYRRSGNIAAAEEEAYLLSGTRKWEEFTDAGRAYLKVLREGPEAHKANGDKIDDQLAATKKLHNEWTELINKLKVDLKFPGDETIGALTGLLQAMERVLGWFDSHPSGPRSGDQWPVDMSGMPGDFPGTSGGSGGGPSGTGPASGSGGGPFGGFSGPGGGLFGLDTGAPTIGSNPAGGGGNVGGSGTNWDQVAFHEASGNWKMNSGNGFYGGLQFDQATWDAYKPPGAPARADLATREQQIAAGENRLSGPNGAAGGWPKTFHDHPELFGAPGGTGGAAASPGGGPGFDSGSGAVGGAGGAGFSGSIAMPAGQNATYTPALMAQLGIPPLATNPASGNPTLPQWIQDFVHQYGGPGLTAGSSPHGALHGTPGSPDWATDVTGPAAEQDRLASYLLAHPELSAQMIHQSQITGQDYGVAGGQAVPTGTYYTTAGGTYADEGPMVHWAPAGQPGGGGTTQGYTVSTGGGPGGTPGSGGSPFVPGTGETERQQRDRQRAVDDAKGRADDADQRVKDTSAAIGPADTARRAAQAKVDALGPGASGAAFDEAQAAATKTLKEYNDALKAQTKALTDQTRAHEDVGDALQDQADSASKAPPTSKGGKGGAYGAAEGLGAGLLSGIAESLGFPDLFGGKPPWEFGSVKLGLGALNWGMGFAKSHGLLGGGDAPGGMAGLGKGLGGSIGLPGLGGLGGPFQGGAPGVNPDGSTGPAFGGPGNPIPAGTVSSFTHVGNIDNSINVSAQPYDVHNVQAWQAAANSQQRMAQTVAAPGAVPA